MYCGFFNPIFKKKIVRPLNELVKASLQIQNKNFEIQLSPQPDNELGLLSNAFYRMNQELYDFYQTLEEKIDAKTLKLTQSNQSLKLLYESSIKLASPFISPARFEECLQLMMKSHGMSAIHLVIENLDRPHDYIRVGEPRMNTWFFTQLKMNQMHLGYLCWQGCPLLVDQMFISSLSVMFSRSIYFNRLHKQALNNAVVGERNALARELHDSIAQSISYLKIQTSLLKRSLSQSDTNSSDLIVKEMSSQLSLTYKQLRELISAFRVSANDCDLGIALCDLQERLKAQTNADILLFLENKTLKLSSERQSNLIFILNEIAFNAIQHANASCIEILCQQREKLVTICIKDDGIGFNISYPKTGHFGLSMMRERAHSIDAELHIHSRINEGTEISISFFLEE